MKLYSVLVTGANRGIGLEFVKQLVTSQDAPEFVFATYRNRDARQDLKAIREDSSTKSTLYLIKLDVTKQSDIEGAKKIIEDMVGHKGLTLLINNAGFLDIQPFRDLREENLNTHFAINSVGPLMVFQAALNMAMRIAAAKVKEDRILVVNMCPGGVMTDMSTKGAGDFNMEDMLEAQKEVEIQTPEVSIKRMLAAIAKMDEANHGTFVSNLGEVYPF